MTRQMVVEQRAARTKGLKQRREEARAARFTLNRGLSQNTLPTAGTRNRRPLPISGKPLLRATK
jgi:hypothetical protein